MESIPVEKNHKIYMIFHVIVIYRNHMKIIWLFGVISGMMIKWLLYDFFQPGTLNTPHINLSKRDHNYFYEKKNI